MIQPQRPQAERVTPSKKAKEMMERKRNWVFMDPDDAAEGPSMEEVFNVHEYDSDGQEKKSHSALERFYEKLDRKANGETNNNKSAKGERYTKKQEQQDEIFLRVLAHAARR